MGFLKKDGGFDRRTSTGKGLDLAIDVVMVVGKGAFLVGKGAFFVGKGVYLAVKFVVDKVIDVKEAKKAES